MIAMTALPPAPYGLTVSGFSPDDLAELVVLQRCCWVAEAIANNTLEIPALPEDATEVLRGPTSDSVKLPMYTRETGSVPAKLHGRGDRFPGAHGNLPEGGWPRVAPTV
jgi:hypothetical protein